MNITEQIYRLIPVDTAFIQAYTEGQTITTVEVDNKVGNVSPEDIVLNLLLTALLKMYGIDVSQVCKDYVGSTDKRIVAVKPLLEAIDISDKVIKVNGVNKPFGEYILETYNCSDMQDFANKLYSELSSSLYNSNTVTGNDDEALISINKTCGDMAHDLAVAIGSNDFFDITTEPEAVTDWTKVFEKTEAYLRKKNILTDTGVLTITPSGETWQDTKGYDYVSVIDMKLATTDTSHPFVHFPFIVVSKNPIQSISFNLSSWWYNSWTEITPIIEDSNGNIQSGSGGRDSGNRGFAIWRNETGSVPYIEPILENTPTPTINLTHLRTTTSEGETTPIVYGSSSLHFGYAYANLTQAMTYDKIIWNNEDVQTLSNPDISPKTGQNLEDNNIGIVGGNIIKYLFNFILDKFNILNILLPSSDPLDDGRSLKTTAIDITLGVDLNDGISRVEDITPDIVAQYKELWNGQIEEKTTGGGTNIGYTTWWIPNENLTNFLSAFWDTSFFDEDFGNMARDAVQKFYKLPFSIEDTDVFSPASPIYFGTKTKDGLNAYMLKKYSKTIYSATKVIDPKFYSFLDYEPNCDCSIYIPFLGLRKLDISMVINCAITIRYEICIHTGDFVVSVLSANKTDLGDTTEQGDTLPYLGVPILQETGNMAVEIPVVGKENSTSSAIGSILGILGGVVATIASSGVGAIAGAGAVVSGALTLPNNMTGKLVTSNVGSGSITSWLTNYVPYMLISYKEPIHSWSTSGTAFDKTIGKVSQVGKYIKNCGKGYHEIDSVKLDGLQCTEKEKKMIEDILMGGFYYGSTGRHIEENS